MEENETEQQEIEVTSLDATSQQHAWRRYSARWLRSRHGRITLSALTLLIVLGSLATMLAHATPDPFGAMEIAFGGPTPTVTPFIPPGGDTFGIIHTAPWGDLRIDGRTPTLRTIAPIGQGFTLPRGVHHLVYRARYFPTLSCVITVPQSYSDTCQLANSAGTAGVTFQRILDLQAIPDRLRFDEYKLLLGSVEFTLSHYSATTTIQPGERYVDQSGKIEVARAAMNFVLGVSQIQRQADSPCQLLCPTDQGSPGSAGPWYLDAQVSPVWTVTDAAGHAFVSPLTPRQAPSAITLTVSPDGSGWSVANPNNDLLDSFVQGAASGAVANQFGNFQGVYGGGTTSGANPADGSVVVLNENGQPAILLWRFGILYAVNAEAARLFPKLPLASQQERTLAQTMAAGIQS